MSANIARYPWRSRRDCLLSAAAVCMSSFLPASQRPDGSWWGVLEPTAVVADYEDRYGPVPDTGADPGLVWDLCRSAYGFDVYYPSQAFGWELDRAARIVGAGIPLLVSYHRQWDWNGNPVSTHAATIFTMDDDLYGIWDADYAIRDLAWSPNEFWVQWIYRDGWQAWPKWTGWIIAIVPRGWELPE